MVEARRALLVAIAGASACGEPAAHVGLEPVALPASCGRPKNATGIRVIAYTEGGEQIRAVGLDETVDLDGFPAETEQLGVEVATGGGALGAIGKSAPLDFGELEDQARIPIVMLPPGGYCETAGFMTTPRRAPLLARAGSGVLVVGGRDAAGNELGSAEFYDPRTATFTPVEVSDVLGASGFAGASLATLPDGRVAVSGGPQPVITIFDPETRTFGESVLIVSRAFHASIALGGTQLLLAGGCADVAAGTCSGLVRNSSALYDADRIASGVQGPVLRAARIGAVPLDLGVLDDGKHWYALGGGEAQPGAMDPSAIDRISPDESDAATIAGLRAQVAALDGGALVSAFTPGDAAVAMIAAPGASAAKATALAPPLVDARLVTLEDGRVAAFGGDPAGGIQLYDPTIDRWVAATPTPPPNQAAPAFVAPALHRLPDGSVFVIDGGAASTVAYLYRPSLVGPSAGSVTVNPGGETTTVLTPVDPETIQRGQRWELVATRGDLARALVGGPRIATGSVRAAVRVAQGGLALLADQTGPGQVLVGELAPGAKARIVRRAGGEQRVLCSGKQVADFDPMIAVTARLEISGTTARLFRDDEEVASCDVGAVERGAWGVAALGDGARVAVETVTVAR